MLRFLICVFIALTFSACSNITFVYSDKKDSLEPMFERTLFAFSGKDMPALYKYASEYFGNAVEEGFRLNLSVDEEKTKRSIQSNQVVSKLDYELTMIFSLENIGKDCIIYENTIYSRFSYVPKSSGYNFGSDQSLEKLYELAAKETFEKIINLLSAADLSSCKNED